MSAPASTHRLPGAWTAALAAALLVVYVWPLALDTPLLDPDEGLHASIAQEMVERGDLVTPRLLGEPFLDKPILFFWAQAAAIAAFGAHERAIRAVGLGFGVLGVATTVLLGAALFGRATAVLAGLCYTTMLLPLAMAQAAVHDIALVPWVNLAVFALWRSCRAARGAERFAWAAFSGVWLGLAILTKGLAGVAVVGLAVGTWVLLSRRLRPRLVLAGLAAVAIGACLALPWYLAVERTRPGYLGYFFLERHVLGYATGTQRHGHRPWWYYLPIVVGGALPWTLAVLAERPRPTRERRHGAGHGPDPRAADADDDSVPSGGAAAAVAGRSAHPLRADADDARLLAWSWVGGGLLFFSAAGSKLVTYVFPLFPPLALLAAAAWTRWLLPPPRLLTRTAWVAVAAHGAAMAVLVAASPVAAELAFGADYGAWTRVAAGLLGLAWAIAPFLVRARPAWRAFATTVGLTCLTVLLGLSLLLPPVARLLTARELAHALNRVGRLPSSLWIADERIGSVVFYLDPALRAQLSPDRIRTVGMDALLGMRQPVPGTLIAIPADRVQRLERRIDLADAPFTPAGQYRLYTAEAWHRALTTGRGAPHGRSARGGDQPPPP